MSYGYIRFSILHMLFVNGLACMEKYTCMPLRGLRKTLENSLYLLRKDRQNLLAYRALDDKENKRTAIDDNECIININFRRSSSTCAELVYWIPFLSLDVQEDSSRRLYHNLLSLLIIVQVIYDRNSSSRCFSISNKSFADLPSIVRYFN